jgi:Uma2 family endonuclease
MSQTPEEAPAGPGRLTYEDFLALPDDGKRYEILDGELAVTPSPATRHQITSINLESILHTHVKQHRLGTVLHAPMDVILDAHTIVEPDILFVSAGRRAIIQEHAIVGPPDLLIEILSPTTSRRDRGIKATLYARFGVEHYWIVDPVDRTVDVYARAGTAYGTPVRYAHDAILRPTIFPELAIDLSEIWD